MQADIPLDLSHTDGCAFILKQVNVSRLLQAGTGLPLNTCKMQADLLLNLCRPFQHVSFHCLELCKLTDISLETYARKPAYF